MNTQTLTELIIHKLFDIVQDIYHHQTSNVICSELMSIWTQYDNSRMILYTQDDVPKIAARCIDLLLFKGIIQDQSTALTAKTEILKVLHLGLQLSK